MPNLKVMQLGKPTVEALVPAGSTYADGFAALGLGTPAAGQILLNGATPVDPNATIPGGDTGTTTVQFNAQVKGA